MMRGEMKPAATAECAGRADRAGMQGMRDKRACGDVQTGRGGWQQKNSPGLGEAVKATGTQDHRARMNSG